MTDGVDHRDAPDSVNRGHGQADAPSTYALGSIEAFSASVTSLAMSS